MKIYVEEIILCMLSDEQMYFNIDTYEYDFEKGNEKGWIEIPLYDVDEVSYNYVMKKINEDGDKRFRKILNSKCITEDSHDLIEEYDLFHEWSVFRRCYESDVALRWCEENKLDYLLEELDEEQIKKIDEKTLNYYEKKDSFLK